MNDTDVVSVPVFNDGERPVAYISIRVVYLKSIAAQSNLDFLEPQTTTFYACVEGPVLVLQGTFEGKSSIRGLTIEVGTLFAESAIYRAWKENRAEGMTIVSVHNAILEAMGSTPN